MNLFMSIFNKRSFRFTLLFSIFLVLGFLVFSQSTNASVSNRFTFKNVVCGPVGLTCEFNIAFNRYNNTAGAFLDVRLENTPYSTFPNTTLFKGIPGNNTTCEGGNACSVTLDNGNNTWKAPTTPGCYVFPRSRAIVSRCCLTLSLSWVKSPTCIHHQQ
jgi:hypothetical protein